MRRVMTITFALAFLATVPVFGGGDAAEYGDGVTIDKAVAVETLLASPDDYVGKTIRVDGVITGVCKKRGCWMQVTDPDTGNGVRIKVDDGVIVFPYEAMGKKASAEGVFEAIALTPEQVRGPRRTAGGRTPARRGRELRQDRPQERGGGLRCAGAAKQDLHDQAAQAPSSRADF